MSARSSACRLRYRLPILENQTLYKGVRCSVDEKRVAKGSPELAVQVGDAFYFCETPDAATKLQRHPKVYVHQARLPARLSGEHRFGSPPRTLQSIAAEARKNPCISILRGARSDSQRSAELREEGLAELREELQDTLTFVEVSHGDI